MVDSKRTWASEFVGTALLLTAIVGSGIMGDRLSSGNVAIALLANTISTGAALFVLILTLGPISGAHFNPIVTLASATQGATPWTTAALYVSAQTTGALAGVGVAHAMFGEPIYSWSHHARSGWPHGISEVVATFGLVAVIHGNARRAGAWVAVAVAAYITSAYWFTASTSFANPAVTLARAFTDTFTGIRLADVPLFVAAQAVGAVGAVVLFRWLLASPEDAVVADSTRARSQDPFA